MTQFEIWWAELREPAGRPPVLLLSRPDAYTYINKFIVAEITSLKFVVGHQPREYTKDP